MSKTNKKTQNNSNASKKRKNVKQTKQSNSKKGNGSFGGKQASVAAAYATRSQGRAPQIQASRDHCNIKHREFLGNIVGSVAFTNALTVPVNPGLPTSFPWLSVTAQAWEQYKFKKLNFIFLTRTGSQTPGSVIMSPDYDPSDGQPLNEQIQSTYEGTAEDAPWKDNKLVLRPQLMSGNTQRKFVRTGALSPNQDVKLYDSANVYIATVDGTAIPWGKLWVEYEIDFYIPQLPPNGLGLISSTVSGTAGSAAAIVTTGQIISGNLIASQVGNVISFQNLSIGSEYLITCSVVAGGGTITSSSPVGLTLKTALISGSTGDGTYVATANVGSLTMTPSGVVTDPIVVINPIPTLVF